nr:DNA methylase [Butyricicoccus sp. AF86-03b2A]
MRSHTYLAIDLKSFYASVECRERRLDPLDTHLVVADETRTDKTICLAVTPSLKSYGISGRGRLFEVRQRVKQVNAERQRRAPGHTFTGASYSAAELRDNPSLAMNFIIAPPHMAHYMAYSSRIYAIYMKYVAPEDMVVYSIDEVFMDVTGYLETYGLTARELARKIILDVLNTTGITATAGIGTNLFLCKVAMDIVAKHVPADRDGVRIAELDERRFRHELWSYQPLTDFWRVGRGTAKKLEQYGMCTMGDIALCSEKNEDLLYKLFGKNAELLIDHAWGWEPCTVADIKAYKPSTNSISTGQVLACPYTADKARLVVREMADQLVLDLVSKGFVTDRLVLTVGYDIDNLNDPARRIHYHGKTETDRYGRTLPKSAHGTQSLGELTSSTQKLMDAATVLFDRIIDPNLLIRRMYLVADHILPESDAPQPARCEQLDLFTDYAAEQERRRAEQAALERERKLQQAALAIKSKYGKNALLKGMNLEKGATAVERNGKIGGHNA